jgi:hypothetical protein
MVLKQDAVLERLMPALDLVPPLPVAGRAVHVTHIAFVPRTCAGATGDIAVFRRATLIP